MWGRGPAQRKNNLKKKKKKLKSKISWHCSLKPGEICVVMDGPCHHHLTVPLTLVWSRPAASFWQIQLLMFKY